MDTFLKFFSDTLHALDNAFVDAIKLIIPAAALLAAGWLREKLLRAKAKSAALEAELEDHDSEEAKVDSALGKVDLPFVLRGSDKKMRQLVRHESIVAQQRITDSPISARRVAPEPPKEK